MEPRGRHRRWAALAGAAVLVFVLATPSTVSGSAVGRSPTAPPPSTCGIPFPLCYIVLSIGSGSQGNKETVTGTQFYPDEPYAVYFWNPTSGKPAEVASGETGTGSFSVSFLIPKDPVGGYTVYVTDSAGDNQSASFQLTHLRADPGSGSVGNTTSLSGLGFGSDRSMEFHLHGALVSVSGHCRTNRYGNFSACRVTIPDVPTGPALLAATDGTYTARIEFEVI
jgi:hypothetical protein